MDSWSSLDVGELAVLAQLLESRRQQDPQIISSLIQIYKQMIELVQPEENPLLYALTQYNLGISYFQLTEEDRATNFKRAIICFQEALRFLTPEVALLSYVRTCACLGFAYTQLPTDNQETNLKQAITCYQEALRFTTRESTPYEYANIQYMLGNAYSEMPTEDPTTNLSEAITCYREALHFFTFETTPREYADVQKNLGSAYFKMPKGDSTVNLTQAITCCREALRFFTPETAPVKYADIQTDLGHVYTDLPTGDPAANLSQAITCYQEALRFFTPETAPVGYALLQNLLGDVYCRMQTRDRTTNRTLAIACFQQALRFFTPEDTPSYYALAQYSMGNAYSSLPTGDRRANVALAIACYQQTLRIWTPVSAPLDYARSYSRRGDAHMLLSASDRANHLKQAIACYREALRFLTPETAPLEYVSIQLNLGEAYSHLPTGDWGAKLANQQQAITCIEEALHYAPPKTAPYEYAIVQASLGAACHNLSIMLDKVSGLKQAIACYQESLRFLTPETAPLEYARIQTQLGRTYRALSTVNRAANLKRAIACYREALRFFTLEATPDDYREVYNSIADIYFTQGKWAAALRAYHSAIDAGERIYRASLSTESKRTTVAQNIACYRNAAFSAVRRGKIAEAFLILERGKTRLLSEVLQLQIPRPKNVSDDVWSNFERASAVVRAAHAEEPMRFGEKHNPLEVYTALEQTTRAASAALDAAIESVQIHAPEFLRSLDISAVQELLPGEHSAIVAFCITEQGSIAFRVSHRDRDIRIVEAPTFTRKDLLRLLAVPDVEGRPIGGWLIDFDTTLNKRTPASLAVWREMMTKALVVLGQHLLAPVLSALPSDTKWIIFLPSAELFLLPLHAAPVSDLGSELMCDLYKISYAPSLEVLTNTRAKALQEATPDLYAVINPTADPQLAFTPIEGAVIAKLFAQQRIDEGRRAGTKQRVIAGVQGRVFLHFSCHGSYIWDNPTLSGLDLADGRLTLNELQHGVVNLSTARLITLSACQTGINDVSMGSAEEYVGVPAGFLIAGAPCVISSLWAVPDLSTALLMERLYRNHLQAKMDIPEALRCAQKWVRELRAKDLAEYTEQWYRQYRKENQTKALLCEYMDYFSELAKQNPDECPFAHPYFWAAFTVNGL